MCELICDYIVFFPSQTRHCSRRPLLTCAQFPYLLECAERHGKTKQQIKLYNIGRIAKLISFQPFLPKDNFS